MAHACAFSPFNLPALNSPAARQRRRAAAMACSLDAASGLLQAAKLTVDTYVRDGMVVGLGSGRASCFAIQYLGRRLREGALRDIVGIPTSVPSASEAAKAGIRLDNFQENLQIDFTFDDADMVEEGKLNAVIGQQHLDGGESVLQEKTIIKAAKKLALIVAEKQYTKDLYGSIPVLVNSGAWMETAEEIHDLFLGDAEVWRRAASGHAGPSGGDFPFVTKEGHYILDVIFTSPILDLAQVAESLDQINGVVDHGVIFGIPCTVIVASQNGAKIVENMSDQQQVIS